ncbi:putative nuclease HARBI1 [Rhagoletis pomonella]|uniref:putative nuclease HARBI1 n=1 Tax=Rhagoletis pomonella TaxID=28610 RepID=UPI00177D570F|nr:putative nuclease HARBI1 [Rhagoletis pomonella]
MEGFQTKRANSFPFVVGCADGTHFKINRPSNDAVSYYDRKGTYSINMQAICDSNLRFLDVFIGYPGSCHDANVWRNSPIYKGITSGEVELASGAVILADSAYPLSKYMIVPFRDNGHLSSDERKFNYILSSTRVLIEQAFGVLRSKFRILNHIDVTSLKSTSEVVLACTILHNFIIKHCGDSSLADAFENTGVESNIITESNHEIEVIEIINDYNEGVARRNELKMLFLS